jgi:hypothetical protein
MHAGHNVPKAGHKLAVVLQVHGGLAKVLVALGLPRFKVADDVGRLVLQLVKLLKITVQQGRAVRNDSQTFYNY